MGWFRRNEHNEEQLSAYLDGELDARQAENVERHLVTCDACAALLEELRSTRALLSALPAQTPTRSFVLGAEYARAPVRDVAAPSRRFNLALAPAVALSVFVALLFVDLASFSSSDESADQFTAATSREVAEDASRSAAGAAELAPAAADSTMQQSDGGSDPAIKADEDAAANAASGAPGDAAGGAVASPEGPPSIMSIESAPTPAAGDTAITAAGEADEEPVPETLAFDAPRADGDGDGISTLRILQVLAAAAFLASGFYVFVWPRVSRGGS